MLIHVALSIFLAGLVASFHTTVAGTVGIIVVSSRVIYFSTNLLPIFKPDCPYKTPLSLDCHDISTIAWPRIKTLLRLSSDGKPLEEHMTYRGGEGVETWRKHGCSVPFMVVQHVRTVRAACVGMQGLNNMPLKEVKAIHKVRPLLSDHIRSKLVDCIGPDR